MTRRLSISRRSIPAARESRCCDRLVGPVWQREGTMNEEKQAEESSDSIIEKWTGNRRVLLKAAAGVAAFAAAGGVLQTALPVPAKAQNGPTLAKDWFER